MKDSSMAMTEAATPEGAPLLLTVDEAQSALKISRWSLYQLLNSGRLKSFHIERRRLIALADLNAFVDELREKTGEGGDNGK